MPKRKKPKLPSLPERAERHIREFKQKRDKAIRAIQRGVVDKRLRDALKDAGVSHVVYDNLSFVTKDLEMNLIEMVRHDFETLLDHLDKIFDIGDPRRFY